MTGLFLALLAGFSPKAMALSLIVPGAGEWSLGETHRAIPFFVVEASSWISWGTLQNLRGRTVETYRGFAYHYAGADATRTDEAYWHAVEFYPNRAAYLEGLWMEARALYPDDPEAQAAYVASRDVGGTWSWPKESLWFRFQDLRARVRSYEGWATVSLGLLVLNRLASVVDVFLMEQTRGRVGLDFRGSPTEFSAGIHWRP